jgi:hypothetical protein
MSRRTLPTLAEGNPNGELLRLGQEHDVAFARVLDVNRQPDGYDDADVSAICGTQADLEFAI